MKTRFCILILGIMLTVQAAAAQDVLIRNSTVLTITNGTLENTDVLIRDGIIAEVGTNIRGPRGIEEVDGTGKFLMPGIIDAHSHIALSSVNEGSSPVTAEVTMEDVINPYHIGIYRALAGGVTTSHTMHGSANVIGGQNETIKHRYGSTDPDDIRFEGAPRTIKFALGENPTRSHGRRGSNGGGGIVPATRMGVEQVLRSSFENGRRYMEAWATYEADAKTNPRAVPPEYNDRLEIMAAILRGEILVHCHSYRADEIVMLTRVLGDFGVNKITFQHANEAFKVAPELAAFGASASVFADWWSYKFEVYYSTAYNAAILMRNGVLTSINSDSPELNRHLYHEAAKSQRYGGLSDNEALSMITINPASQLGIQDRVGSIEIGKDGDVVLFNAHPLSVYAIAELTYVDGKKYFDRSADPDDMRLDVSPTASFNSFETQITGKDHFHDENEVLDWISFFDVEFEEGTTSTESQNF